MSNSDPLTGGERQEILNKLKPQTGETTNKYK